MGLLNNLALLAQYNATMNERLYKLASELPSEILKENKGAFFGSIQATLNHLLVGDLTWLNRFSKHPSQFTALTALSQFPVPTALDQPLYEDFDLQFKQRTTLDAMIISFVGQLTAQDLDNDFHYQNFKGLPFTRNFGSVLLHFFNHQTHHRGQTTTLLNQCGVDYGITDFIVFIPETSPPG